MSNILVAKRKVNKAVLWFGLLFFTGGSFLVTDWGNYKVQVGGLIGIALAAILISYSVIQNRKKLTPMQIQNARFSMQTGPGQLVFVTTAAVVYLALRYLEKTNVRPYLEGVVFSFLTCVIIFVLIKTYTEKTVSR
jgi:hypothetical protein